MRSIFLLTLFFAPSLNTSRHTFRRKSEKWSFKEHLRKSIHKGKVENLPQIPKLDKILDVKSLTIVSKETAFDPCKTSKDRCLNNGRCESRDGMFICHCPVTHYGKLCEKLADAKNCANHKCKNGAVCLSTEQKSEVLDTDKLHEKKKLGTILTEEEMLSLMVTIEYECICNEGFVGPLCEISEKAQYCEEQHCNGRGTGSLDSNGTCTCQCDSSKWYGDRCEFKSPCANFECFNSGKCETKVDPVEGTIEAFCKCSNGTEIIDTSISGEHCEIVEAKYSEDEKARYIPCTNYSSHDQWLRDMSSGMSTADHDELYSIYEDCKEINGQWCRYTNALSVKGKWCYGNATCEPRVATVGSGLQYLVPFCICEGGLISGRFCEYIRINSCDPTREEIESGHTRETRCTSLDNGICVDVLGTPVCNCRPSFVGEACETYNPCARNPCGKPSECIPIPNDKQFSGELSRQGYRCICDMDDELSTDNLDPKCVYMGTGNCTGKNPCNQGQCMSCEYTTTDGMIQMCNEKEKKDGFRCVCEPGFKPPYCKSPADACFDNLCTNGGVCVSKSKFQYDCKCPNGTRGSLCEHIDDYCSVFGDETCKYGSCYSDISAKRQFSCDCNFGYYGRDCERELNMAAACVLWLMENSNISMPLISIMCTITFLFLTYFWCSQEDRMLSNETVNTEVTGEDEMTEKSKMRRRRVMASLRIQDAIQGNKKILRSKKHNDRLACLMKRLLASRNQQAKTHLQTEANYVLQKSAVVNNRSESSVNPV